MKNTRAPLLLALLFSVLPVFFACEKPDELIPVESISLDKRSAEMIEGESLKLTATITPSNASNKNIGWKSDKPEIATVDQNGNVTAIIAGKAIISAISEDGGKSATCAVTVKAKVINVSSVTLSQTSASLKAGETITLEATANPSDATDKTVTWSTTDAMVATVDNGVVTAKQVGTATITAKAGDKTATCTITVVATPVESISLNQTSASLKAGETVTLTAMVGPDDATDKTVTWSTTDATVATVVNGVVTAKKVGTATITAKAGDKTATCTITVVATPVTSISLDKTSASLIAGETLILNTTVSPADATDKTITWSTTDAAVASVSDGVVTAKDFGTVTITAKAGEKTAACTINVNNRSNNLTITLSWTENTGLTYGNIGTITINNPSNGTLSISSEPSTLVATASLSGDKVTITPVASGETSMTIKSAKTIGYSEAEKTILIKIL